MYDTLNQRDSRLMLDISAMNSENRNGENLVHVPHLTSCQRQNEYFEDIDQSGTCTTPKPKGFPTSEETNFKISKTGTCSLPQPNYVDLFFNLSKWYMNLPCHQSCSLQHT